jgi:hypothetical protein
MQAFILALLPLVALADHAPHGYGGYGPKYHCRDTNTSVYAEVCVPAFEPRVTPIDLAVKNIVDNDYCYTQIRTVCEETESIVEREICTYTYSSVASVQPATTTKVTYEEKSETMKVTTCSPSGYGDHYGAGEHQYCRAEYQTQAYRVPLVTVPLEVSVDVAVPVPAQVCVTKEITITEVKCTDIEEEKCFNVAKFEDGINTVEQIDHVLGEPNCNAVTLTLPTQACSKGYHH